MKVWTSLSSDDLYDIADDVGVRISDQSTCYDHRPEIAKDGRAYRFNLRPSEYRDEYGNHHYQRVSASVFTSGRRVHAVCWHGHRDFMKALYERDPDARIKTMFFDYRGKDSFYENFPETGYRNVGSMMYPQFAKDVCTCAEYGVY